jgi:hypothetical protein
MERNYSRSPVKARDLRSESPQGGPAVIQREIIELLRTREKLIKNALTQKDIERFHRKYVRSQMTRIAKRETLTELLTDALNPYDIAMALEIPLEDAIEALVLLEREKKILPISEALRRGDLGDLIIELIP